MIYNIVLVFGYIIFQANRNKKIRVVFNVFIEQHTVTYSK